MRHPAALIDWARYGSNCGAAPLGDVHPCIAGLLSSSATRSTRHRGPGSLSRAADFAPRQTATCQPVTNLSIAMPASEEERSPRYGHVRERLMESSGSIPTRPRWQSLAAFVLKGSIRVMLVLWPLLRPAALLRAEDLARSMSTDSSRAGSTFSLARQRWRWELTLAAYSRLQ